MSNYPEMFMIRALPVPNDSECLKTFFDTVGADIDQSAIKIVDERETREHTLNYILSIRNKERDLFVFVDDIRFEKNWWKTLQSAKKNGDIVGFSMVDPETGLLQDFGYDFVKVESQLSYCGLYKGVSPSSVKMPGHRECSAVCGCAMWISKEVLAKVNQFPPEGHNRWGELLFSTEAKRFGFKTVVASANLRHFGTSTKRKSNPKLSSLSWLVESALWNEVVEKFLHDVEVASHFDRQLSDRLMDTISTHDRVVIYGCGTVADLLCKKIVNKDFSVVAGLPEEIGNAFHGRKVEDVRCFKYRATDLVIVTPIGYRKQLAPMFHKCHAHLIWLYETEVNDKIVYDFQL